MPVSTLKGPGLSAPAGQAPGAPPLAKASPVATSPRVISFAKTESQLQALDAMVAPLEGQAPATAHVNPGSLDMSGKLAPNRAFRALAENLQGLNEKLAAWEAPDAPVPSRAERHAFATELVAIIRFAEAARVDVLPAERPAMNTYDAAERATFLRFSRANDLPHGEEGTDSRLAQLNLSLNISYIRDEIRDAPNSSSSWRRLFELEADRLHT